MKQQNTHVPTSVRTIETVIDVPGWAPITPYLNVSKHLTTPSQDDVQVNNNNLIYTSINITWEEIKKKHKTKLIFL